MIEKWFDERREGALKSYQDELADIETQGRRIEAGADLILKKIPAVGYVVGRGDYDVHFVSRSRRDPIDGSSSEMTEFTAVVTLGKGDSREIFSLEFCDESYPSLHIDKGFTVKFCNTPGEFKNFLDLVKPGIWSDMGYRTPEFLTVVGVGLYGMLDRLTEREDSKDLEKCLTFLEEQVGELP